jgi:secreted PhoX family phosphatase
MERKFTRKQILSLAAACALAFTTVGCSSNGNGSDGDSSSTNAVSFSSVSVPTTDDDKRSILAASTVQVNDTNYSIGYNTILRSGTTLGGYTFGLILDENGDPITNDDGAQSSSDANDFSSLLTYDDRIFMISHFEQRPIAAMYLSELIQDSNGLLAAISTEPIDFSAYKGLWIPCAGSVSPWGTHIGSEEYPTDAAMSETDDVFAAYFDDNSIPNVYNYGWTTEVSLSKVDDKVTPTAVKHYSMGRFNHELAYVMPDEKTVYLTDDGTNGTFFKFIANTAQDLTEGTLYAAKWTQTSDVDSSGGSATISWVNLGSATNSEIKTAVDSNTTFSDIFTSATPSGDGTCEDGYYLSTYGNDRSSGNCLKINSGYETIASRLESGRYASMMGATSEFTKMEGFTFNPADSEAYLALSSIKTNMASGDDFGSDDIKVEVNKCGAVYKMSVDDNYSITSMEAMVIGEEYDYSSDANYSENSCHVDKISMPDNVTFLTNSDTLIIGEDTSYHQNDVIWAYDMGDDELTRIQTTPYGSETTSPYFYPNIGGYGYLMSVVQHPFGESDRDQQANEDESKGYTGYVGPFPAMD